MTYSLESYSRGYTDFLTGVIKILDIPSSHLTGEVLQGRLPLRFLSSFLHESTHFWCNQTNIMSCLCLLELQAQHMINSIAEGKERLITHKLVRVKTLRQVLLPLLEGVALFQEFDAYSGSSSVISPPVLWSTQLFGRSYHAVYQPTIENIDLAINSLLNDYRNSDVAFDRKISVFMQPLFEDQHLYLAGYLAVKMICSISSITNAEFLDRQLFLAFFVNWLFNDLELVSILFDSDVDSGRFALLTIERITTRIQMLLRESLHSEIKAFEMVSNQSNPDFDLSLISARQDNDVAEEAILKFRDLYHDVWGGTGTDGYSIDDYSPAWITYEHSMRLMRLGSEKVLIHVSSTGRVNILRQQNTSESLHYSTLHVSSSFKEPLSEEGVKSLIISFTGPAAAREGIFRGEILISYSTEHNSIILTVICGNPVNRNYSISALRSSYEWVHSLHSKASITAEQKESLDGLLYGLWALNELREDVGSQTELFLEKVSSDWVDEANALCSVYVKLYISRVAQLAILDPERIEETTDLLAKHGLYSLFEENADLFAAYTRLSLANPSIDQESLQELLRDFGFTPEMYKESLEKIRSNTGIFLRGPGELMGI